MDHQERKNLIVMVDPPTTNTDALLPFLGTLSSIPRYSWVLVDDGSLRFVLEGVDEKEMDESVETHLIGLPMIAGEITLTELLITFPDLINHAMREPSDLSVMIFTAGSSAGAFSKVGRDWERVVSTRMERWRALCHKVGVEIATASSRESGRMLGLDGRSVEQDIHLATMSAIMNDIASAMSVSTTILPPLD